MAHRHALAAALGLAAACHCGRSDLRRAGDLDRDGFAAPEDCNDLDPAVYPGAIEMCDDRDENCDGDADETFPDKGQRCSAGIGACLREGRLICAAGGLGTICDAFPGAPSAEICGDGVDQDCDGADAPENACGGCSRLDAQPGDRCGACGRTGCLAADAVACADPGTNDCGGCEPLAARPGDGCGTCGTTVCDGRDRVRCGDGTPNACGGCRSLTGRPGDPCAAGSGTLSCSGPDSLTCVTTGCTAFANPDFCNTAAWTPSVRWGDEHADLHPGPPCYAHTRVDKTGYGVAMIKPSGGARLCAPSVAYLCVDYEATLEAGLGGLCELCDGAGGYENCVANLAAYVVFYDAMGNSLSDVYVGNRTFGLGDAVMPDASAAGTLTSDGALYERHHCTRQGARHVFLDTDTTARHKFRARVSDLVPAGVSPVSATLEVGRVYSNEPPSMPTEMKVYRAFLGAPSNAEFCACLGGTWTGSVCAGI